MVHPIQHRRVHQKGTSEGYMIRWQVSIINPVFASDSQATIRRVNVTARYRHGIVSLRRYNDTCLFAISSPPPLSHPLSPSPDLLLLWLSLWLHTSLVGSSHRSGDEAACRWLHQPLWKMDFSWSLANIELLLITYITWFIAIVDK